MSKIPVISSKEIISALEKSGFRKIRQRGSHVVMQRDDELSKTTVVVRADYIAALVQANKGNKTPFFNFITCMAYETIKDYLRIIKQM